MLGGADPEQVSLSSESVTGGSDFERRWNNAADDSIGSSDISEVERARDLDKEKLHRTLCGPKQE